MGGRPEKWRQAKEINGQKRGMKVEEKAKESKRGGKPGKEKPREGEEEG